MKNLFLSIALLLCSILLLPNIANATCPPEGNGGTWFGPEIAIIQIDGCIYEYSYCYRIDSETGFHEIALTEISIMPPCNGENFEPNKQAIMDKILIDIAQGWVVQVLWRLGEIPECPATLCLVRMNDAICYSGWYYDNNENKYKMWICDNLLRSCNETIRICWEGNEQNIVVERIGSMVGPPCPPICRNTCN